MQCPSTPSSAFAARRKALLSAIQSPILLAAGSPPSRNFRANLYPFRASSHYLYLVGRSTEGSALLLHEGKATLFTHPPDPEDALWHGARPSFEQLTEELQVDAVRPLAALDATIAPLRQSLATLPTEDARSAAWLAARLGRELAPSTGDALEGADAELADAMIQLRLCSDAAALEQQRFVAEISAQAHIAGMRASEPGGSEHQVAAAMIKVLREHGLEDAYGPIVTVHGEVLHCNTHDNAIAAGDLLLADVGGETPEGWAADITRTWPVSGRYSATQRAIYDVVLDAQHKALAVAKPGHRYREAQEATKRAMVEGLCQLGILRGDVDGLLERGAAALFFPHGIGHLLGMDVHDMEDLGDRAGYAPGRQRSAAFGDAFLRLDRDLQAGMVVTIEPGFYQVPGILNDARYTGPIGADLNREELAKYADVRGIRIEDDVLITANGNEILTSAVPKEAAAIEALMAG